MDAGEQSSSGGNLYDCFYENPPDEAELSKRTTKIKILNGQAAFFTLITNLGVPVLDKSSNQSGGQDHLFVGLGASYRVTRALFALSGSHSHTINQTEGPSGKLGALLKKRRYVTKRIVPSTSTKADGLQLAAIANEVRILANKTLEEYSNLVKLLCVAWDEVPTLGRHWPRLLLEAAEYGHLGDFFSGSPDAKSWDVKVEIIINVISGLKALHLHGVTHCDLKLENVLVFRAVNKDKNLLGVTYEAKLCDFGFSVIMTDYEEDATFCEQLGTEPWSSPELTFATEIKIKDLPQSDIYSLGLLSSRIFMNGGNPFGDMTMEEIRALKCHEEGNSLLLHNTITSAIFSNVTYTESQSALIKKQLLTTLGFLPEHRLPLHLLGIELVVLGYVFRNPKKPSDDEAPGNGEADTVHVAVPGESQLKYVGASLPPPAIRKFESVLGSFLSLLLTPLRSLCRRLAWAAIWLLQLVRKRLGLFRDPWEDLLKPKDIRVEPIEQLPSVPSFSRIDSEAKREDLEDMPDFENTSKYSPTTLPTSIATEIIHDLIQIASVSGRCDSLREAEAAYQICIAHFEGISFPSDSEKGLQWVERAALGGSKKALTNSPHIFASLGQSMSPKLSAACDSALAHLGKFELLWSSSWLFDGTIAQYENFTAVRRWIETAPARVDEYLSSPEYSSTRAAVFSISLIKHGVQPVENPFDFKLLEGYEPFAHQKFDISNKPRFIKSVRQHRCLQSTDAVSCMTLLQLAAARGDLELTKTLVVDLNANVDACGAVPGLTPLWISCFHGYIDIASFLVQEGAVPTCRDSISNRTILHFLNQFKTEEDIAKVLEIAVKAGLRLEEKDHHGSTPLLSTFVGWDFSDGIATRFLLELRADVLVRCDRKWSPMGAAVKALDVQTSRAIAKKYRASSLLSASRLKIPAMSIEDDKMMAFGTLCSSPEFYRRRVGGREWIKKLQLIVEILLDEGTINLFRRPELSRGSNPLIGMSFTGHDDLVAVILESTHCPGLDEVDETNGMSALHWSVERGRIASTMKLLSMGANPLLRDKTGLNVFHRAARFSPTLLLQILENIDSANLPRPPGHNIRSILAIDTPDGLTPFAIAVIEGSSQHLEVAETLRKTYQIDHDSYSLQKSRTKIMTTLMAYLIDSSISSNIFTLEQVEYVLNIEPRPNFVGDTSGDTLLHYAVGGWQYPDISSNQVGYAVLRLLLRTFPGRAHLDVTNSRGYTPLHHAVYHANVIALEIIKDHLRSLGEEMDPNLAGPGAPSPLDGLGQIRTNCRLKEEDEPYLYAVLKKNTAKTYELMRNLGGSFSSEREGAMISIFGRVQNELTKERLLRFLEASRIAFGVEWEFVEVDIPLSAAGTEEASFVIELCWAFDHFVLRAKPILTENMGSHIEERANARLKFTKGEQKFPWTETEHSETILGHPVQWTRRGRAWTIEERRTLATKIENVWTAMFPSGQTNRIIGA